MKLEEIEKDFYELRHKISKSKIKDYIKAFYIAKNYKHISELKIKKKKELLPESERRRQEKV